MERHGDGAEPQKGCEEGRAGRPEVARRAAGLAGAGRVMAEKRSVWARSGEREHEEEAPSSACRGLGSGSVVNKIDFN